MVSLKAVATVVTLWVSVTLAQLTITEPSSNRWWVAQSINTLRWTCNTSPHTNWTVLIMNSDTTILSGPLALIAIRKYNYDCSKTIVPGEQLKPGTGYTMQFANPFNNTDVFATSESFEVKPVGSTYPPEITTSEALTATGLPSGTSSPSATPTPGNNGAAANAVGILTFVLAAFTAMINV
ncbi:GPI-anchored small secreted protein [Ceratobasidium sp. AG-Ba]|nr:GPI-anchored small secreted protein [Ceratobasidium sp. AG-Ba]